MGIVASLRKDSLSHLALITDFSYAWKLLDNFIDLMHDIIKSNTKAIRLFTPCFLKLNSILNFPLGRIIEINNERMVTFVSQYYSKKLVNFVGKVLVVIPKTIYKLLEEIANTFTNELKAEKAVIINEEYLNYALFEERYRLAKEVHNISLLVEGMLGMDKCFMGMIEVDPKEVLVSGIKNEIVNVITTTLNFSLIFKKDITTEGLELIIKDISNKLDNMRSSLEYMQDFIGIDALTMWLELMNRVINFYVSREIKKPYNSSIQIPIYEPIDNSHTFLGRLLKALMNITSPSKQLYHFTSRNAWFNNNGNLVFGTSTILSLSKAFGVIGVNGLDQVISYWIKENINSFAGEYKCLMNTSNKGYVDVIRKKIRYYYESDPSELIRTSIEKAIEGLRNANKTLIGYLEQIGRLQLIRKVIQQQLMHLAATESKGFNQVINNITLCALPQSTKSQNTIQFLDFISTLSDGMGMSNPLNKIYLYPKYELYSISHMLAIITIDYLKTVTYKPDADIFIRRKFSAECPDSITLLVGIITLLKHMHENYTKEYIVTLCYYTKMTTVLELVKKRKEKSLPVISNVQMWLNHYCKITEQSKDIVARFASNFLLDSFICAN